ncbi:UNVERIFIED_ORG: putative membrane protein [Clostridioides difficile F501]
MVGFCACYFSNLVGFCSFILVIWSAFTLFSDFYCIVCQFITA